MAKDYSLNHMLSEYSKSIIQKVSVEKNIAEGDLTSLEITHARVVLSQVINKENYWRKRIEDFGRGDIVKVTGEIEKPLAEPGVSVKRKFELLLVNASIEDARVFMEAQANTAFKGVCLETIQIKEFQTGRLIIV